MQTEQFPVLLSCKLITLEVFLVNLILKITLAFLTGALHAKLSWEVRDLSRSVVYLLKMQCKSLSEIKPMEKSFNWFRINGFANKYRSSYWFYVEIRRIYFPCYGQRHDNIRITLKFDKLAAVLKQHNILMKEIRCIFGDQSQISLSKSVQRLDCQTVALTHPWSRSGTRSICLLASLTMMPCCENDEIVLGLAWVCDKDDMNPRPAKGSIGYFLQENCFPLPNNCTVPQLWSDVLRSPHTVCIIPLKLW